MVLAYRPATPGDALSLSVLATQVFLDTYATNGVNDELASEAVSVYSPQVFERRLHDPRVSIFIASSADYVVGFADLAFDTQCPSPGVSGIEVFRLYVQRPFLRLGIGRALMSQAENLSSTRGLSNVWLTAWAGNRNALMFYKALGYQDVGATEYVIAGRGYENRILAKRLAYNAA